MNKKRKTMKFESAISRDSLQMATRISPDGKYFIFMKDAGGSYHAFTEITTKSALRAVGARDTYNYPTRDIAKRFLGF